MRIEIREKGTEPHYKEVVNAVTQYRSIVKKPDRDLQDSFEQTKRMRNISIALFVVLSIVTIFLGASILTIIALALSAINIAFSIAHLSMLNRSLARVMSDGRATALIVDENGVALEKEGEQVIRFGWEDIDFVRIYELTMCFFAKAGKGVITVNRVYEEEIMKFIKENKIAVRII